MNTQDDSSVAQSPVVMHARVVTGTGGGPEKTILNSPRFLPALGYEGMCVYMHPPNDPGFEVLQQRAAGWNAKLHSIPDRGIRDWTVFRRLLKLCRQERVSIWHAHDYKSNCLGLMIRRFWPMKLITTAHGWVKFTRRTPFYHWVDRYCQRRYDRVICVSSDIEDACLKHGVKPDRCLQIDNGIDHEEFCRSLSTHDAKKKLGLSPERLTLGAVGRLSDEKGFDILIQAVSQLVEQGRDVQLLIAGEGDARPKLESLIRQQSQPDRFQLLGHRGDIADLVQAMDVFVLSSLREGLPNVVLEAMSLETPVVATRIAGIPRLIEHAENGMLVDPSNQDQLSNAIEQLLANPTMRRLLAQKGRHTIETQFSFADRMGKIAAIYDELLNRGR